MGFDKIRYVYLENKDILYECTGEKEFEVKGTRGLPVVPEFLKDCSDTEPVKSGIAALMIEHSSGIGVPREGPLAQPISVSGEPNLALQPSPGIAASNLCDLLLRSTNHMDCSKTSDNTYVLATKPTFRSGKVRSDENVGKVLRVLASVASQNHLRYDAVIRGYASESAFHCKDLINSLKTWRNNNWMHHEGSSFTLTQQQYLRGGKGVSLTCGSGNGAHEKDGNYFLAYARAAWAASQLISLSSNLNVTEINANGADYALRGNNAADRRISIELRSRTGSTVDNDAFRLESDL